MDFKPLGFYFALFVSLIFMGLTYLFFGFYFTEYEGLNIGLLSGSLTTDMPFRSVYFSGNLVISHFYSLLYEYCPGVEWISWLEYFWMLIACGLALHAMSMLLPVEFSIPTKVVVLAMLYLLVFADHQIHLIYTRVAYVICGVSLICLSIFFSDVATIKNKFGWFVLLNLFFAIGTFIRNEAAIACFLLILPFSLIYLKNTKHSLLLLSFPLLIVGGQSLFLATDIKNATNTEFYKQVEPDIEEQYIARGNLVPLSSMKTYRDTVMYQMAEEMTLSDPRLMTPTYLRSLILPEKFMFTDSRQWQRAGKELKDILLQYWYLVLIVLLLNIALFIQYDFHKQKLNWFYYLTFVFSFWVLVIAQTYVDKVNERSWLPYIGLFILSHILLLAKSIQYGIPRKIYPLLAIGMVLLVVHLYHLKTESNRLKENRNFQQQQLQSVKAIARNRVLAVNSSAFDFLFLSNKPFHPFNFSAFKKVYITDGYIIPFLPYYKRYLESECRCDIYAFPSFWKYLKTTQQQVVIVSQSYRLKAIDNYLSEMHQLPLAVREIESFQLEKLRKNYRQENADEFNIYEFDK